MKKFFKTKRSFFSGFTLVESLIVFSLFVSLGLLVYQVFIFHQRISREKDSLLEINQNGRVLLERISRELRQAREIVTELGDNKETASSEILFLDGHIQRIIEEGNVVSADAKSITLSSFARPEDDFYKETFVKITRGRGAGQIRRIISYDGLRREALLNQEWETIPDSSSWYLINSSYYYLHYFKDQENRVFREVLGFYFSGDPDYYVPYNSTPLSGQTKETIVFEEPHLVGEYVNELKFWKTENNIAIFIRLSKDNQSAKFFSAVYCRNL